MEICVDEPRLKERIPSIIEIKNKIRVGHPECCNCCCCKTPVFAIYKYVQPEIPKSFRPIRTFHRSNIPLEDATIYNMSFFNGPPSKREPVLPQGCLTTAKGNITSNTTQKLSYLGNWCIKPQEKILPCSKNLFGRGPIDSKTIQKQDFIWKYVPKEKPIKYRGNIALPRGQLADDTTYKLSYYNSKCVNPIKSFKPIRKYERSNELIDDCTTYRLSFFQNDVIDKEEYPWQKKPMYQKPITQVDNCTTYKLSYWPHCESRVKPIFQHSDANIFNKNSCFLEKNTTYELSFFGGDSDKPQPIYPMSNKIFNDCPVVHDTINKMSYLGNWCPKPEKLIKPCKRSLLGRGAVDKDTTQKCDFTWKYQMQNPSIKPIGNISFSLSPVENSTTNRLSYLPNCGDCLIPKKSFAPIRTYEPVDLPMDLDTTMQLSFQPVDKPKVIDKPWAAKISYTRPDKCLDEHTTYSMSYIPPGSLISCDSEVPKSDTITIIISYSREFRTGVKVTSFDWDYSLYACICKKTVQLTSKDYGSAYFSASKRANAPLHFVCNVTTLTTNRLTFHWPPNTYNIKYIRASNLFVTLTDISVKTFGGRKLMYSVFLFLCKFFKCY